VEVVESWHSPPLEVSSVGAAAADDAVVVVAV